MRRVLFLLSLSDLLAIAGAAVCALILRDNLEFISDHILALGPYVIFSVLAAAVVMPLLGINRRFWRYSTFNDFVRIALVSVLIIGIATTFSFVHNRLDGLPRSVPVLHMFLVVAFLCLPRALARLCHGRRAQVKPAFLTPAPEHAETVLVVGVNTIAELFIRSAREFASDRIRIVGLIGEDADHVSRLLQGTTILGLTWEVQAILRQLAVHGVEVERLVIAAGPNELSDASRGALATVEDSSSVLVDYFAERMNFLEPAHTSRPARRAETAFAAPAPSQKLPSLPEVTDYVRRRRFFWAGKRAIDILGASCLIIATLPIMLLVGLVVALDIGTPVLFWQERPGRQGRRLRLHKFRTMRSAHDGEGKWIPEGARSSIIGRFLRRSRLDELPQLLHILIGDMSFVGPRPLLPVDQSPAFAGRLAVRPGLTGWAQVHGGREISPSDKAAMDLWYIYNAGFWLDVRIAGKTLRMLIIGDRPDQSAIEQAWRDAEAW